MPTLQIRNIPEEIYEQLKLISKRSHRSLNQQALYLLELALKKEAKINNARKQKALEAIMNRGVMNLDSDIAIQQIRKDRDR